MNRRELGEKFAPLYSLKREIDALVDSKGGTLYGELRDDMRQLYEETGALSREISVEGPDGSQVKVGTVSAITTKASTKHVLYWNNLVEFAMWLATDGLPYFREFMTKCPRESRKLMDECASALVVDGVVPDGCEVKVETEPTRFSHIKVTGCKMADIVAATGRGLPDVLSDALMLPGGDE